MVGGGPDLVPGIFEVVQSAAATGIRDYLRSRVTGIEQSAIDIEYDELPPNLAGDWHLCVIPSGFSVNPTTNNLEVYDWSVMYDLALIRRVQDQPRDRKREKFMRAINSLTNSMGSINFLIDGDYGLMAYQNDELARAYAKVTNLNIATNGFIEPARLLGGSPVRGAGPGLFGGKGAENDAALVCRFRYGKLRIIVPKSAHLA